MLNKGSRQPMAPLFVCYDWSTRMSGGFIDSSKANVYRCGYLVGGLPTAPATLPTAVIRRGQRPVSYRALDAPAGRFATTGPCKPVTPGPGQRPGRHGHRLYDLTNMGIELGGVVGDDGRFVLQVAPLTGNLRIGISSSNRTMPSGLRKRCWDRKRWSYRWSVHLSTRCSSLPNQATWLRMA